MTPSSEERLLRFGYLLLLVGISFLGYLAHIHHWRYAIGIICLFCIWSCLTGPIVKKREMRIRQAYLQALETAFASKNLPTPELKTGRSYSYPTFQLLFRSEAEAEQAEKAGCITEFKQALNAIYNPSGKNSPFDFDSHLAVSIALKIKDRIYCR
ncbi:MAG: hypothetical protein K0Q55_2062 [Verrucomicrobia bacterium]|jgi:hypothetical protein|nr:hypothetical protein [Verrucomicrobiota bacterium]